MLYVCIVLPSEVVNLGQYRYKNRIVLSGRNKENKERLIKYVSSRRGRKGIRKLSPAKETRGCETIGEVRGMMYSDDCHDEPLHAKEAGQLP